MTIFGVIKSTVQYGGEVITGVIEVPQAIGNAAQKATNTISGVVATVVSVATGSKWKEINQVASKTSDSALILPRLISGVLHIENKNIPLAPTPQPKNPNQTVSLKNPIVTREEYFGPTASYAVPTLFGWAMDYAAATKTIRVPDIGDDGKQKMDTDDTPLFKYAETGKFLENHVFSRGCFLLAGIATVITRVFDLVIVGLVTTLAAVVVAPFHNTDKVYKLALSCWTAPGVINDLCIAARGIENPFQFKKA